MVKSYKKERAFLKGAGVYIAGGAVGVLAEKLVNDIIAKGALPNPQFITVQLSDVAMVAAELATAYHFRKKGTHRKRLASNFLVGMATGTVAAQAYEWGAQQGSWVGLQRSGVSASFGSFGNGGGRYGRTAPITGPIGAYLKPVNYTYPRR